ncbi:hypothetical protein FRB90_001025 [Tulasnella sp. 427]|nr:hypothetical protein FRB90_001025 [Tulasnella sp. 427]
MASGKTHLGVGLVEKGVLGEVQVPTRSPGPDEVLLKVDYAALSSADGHAIDDNFFVQGFPQIVGLGAAGKVIEVGSNVDWIKEGDSVAAFTQPGADRATQRYVIAPSSRITKIPSGISPAEVAGLIDNFVCGWHTISSSFGLPLPTAVPPSTSLDPAVASAPILVWGAGTGAGSYMVQALHFAGYKNIIATASSRSKPTIVSYGATHVFDYNDPDVATRILKAAGGMPIKYALDPVCTQDSLANISKVVTTTGSKVALLIPIKLGHLKSLHEGGAHLVIELPADVNPFAKGVEIVITKTFEWEANEQWKRSLLKDILPALLSSSQIKPQEVRLADKEATVLGRLKEAHRLMKDNELRGSKAVVDFNI